MSKYGNKRTTVDGYTFDSLAEARRYQELRLLEKAGEIQELVVHPRYPLHSANARGGRTQVGTYTPDFWYWHKDRGAVVEDVKGVATARFRLQKRMFEAEYDVTLTVIEA